jgi:hypothetical protein
MVTGGTVPIIAIVLGETGVSLHMAHLIGALDVKGFEGPSNRHPFGFHLGGDGGNQRPSAALGAGSPTGDPCRGGAGQGDCATNHRAQIDTIGCCNNFPSYGVWWIGSGSGGRGAGQGSCAASHY